MRAVPPSVGFDFDIVDINTHVLWRKAEQAGTSLLMGSFVRHFKNPGIRLGLVSFPGFRAHSCRAVGISVDARFETIPNLGRPFKVLSDAQAILVGIDLELLFVALQHDEIMLVDYSHLRHLAPVTVTHY